MDRILKASLGVVIERRDQLTHPASTRPELLLGRRSGRARGRNRPAALRAAGWCLPAGSYCPAGAQLADNRCLSRNRRAVVRRGRWRSGGDRAADGGSRARAVRAGLPRADESAVARSARFARPKGAGRRRGRVPRDAVGRRPGLHPDCRPTGRCDHRRAGAAGDASRRQRRPARGALAGPGRVAPRRPSSSARAWSWELVPRVRVGRHLARDLDQHGHRVVDRRPSFSVAAGPPGMASHRRTVRVRGRGCRARARRLRASRACWRRSRRAMRSRRRRSRARSR